MTESELVIHLKANTAIKSLLEYTRPDLVKDVKIFPIVAPQNVSKPFIVYRVVSGLKIQCMGGEIFRGDYRMQLDCYGLTYSSVKSIGQAVKSCLVGFMSSHDLDMSDDYDDEAQLFKQIIDFKIKDKD